jgi:hypothetical protein
VRERPASRELEACQPRACSRLTPSSLRGVPVRLVCVPEDLSPEPHGAGHQLRQLLDADLQLDAHVQVLQRFAGLAAARRAAASAGLPLLQAEHRCIGEIVDMQELPHG